MLIWMRWQPHSTAAKKRDHKLLHALLEVVNQRMSFTEEVAQLKQPLQWLIELEHLLDPEQMIDQAPLTSQLVAEKVDQYLKDLLARTQAEASPEAQAVAAHIEKTLRNHWWGLFQCYDVEGLPRTNNDLERFLRRIKMGQRKITGRKNVQDAIIRYGAYLALVDYQERPEELLNRLMWVPQADFLQERRALQVTLEQEQKRHRFCYHQAKFFEELEARWEEIVNQTKS